MQMNGTEIKSEAGKSPASSFSALEKFSRVTGGKEAGCGGVLADNEAPRGLKSAATETDNSEDTTVKNASNNTFAWSKAASDLVARNLVRDVVGSVIDASKDRADGVSAAKLPHEQAPTGERAPVAVTEGAHPEAAAKLPKGQTPVKHFDSGIVEAAKASVSGGVKTANDEAAPVDPTIPAAPLAPVEAPAADQGSVAPVAPAAPITPAPIGDEATATAAPAPIDTAIMPVDPAAAPAPAPSTMPAPEGQEEEGSMQSFEGIKMASNSMGYNTKISDEDAALLAKIFG